MLRSLLPAFSLLLIALLFTPAAFAQTAELTDVSPQQAREVLDSLQDEDRREEVVRVLEAIASETPVEEEGDTEVVEESPLATIVPLEEGGLIARTLDGVQGWADQMRSQLLRISEAAAELPAWFEESFLTADGRTLLWQTALDLAIVFGVWQIGRASCRERV